MVSFLALLALQIGTIILLRLITPKQKRPKAAPFEAPNAEDGAPIPKIFGMQEISGTLMLVRDKRVSSENDDTRHRYWARMAIGLGWGPYDVLFDIVSDERALSLQLPSRKQSFGGQEPITTLPFPIALSGDAPVQFNISALDMFGGGNEEGGIAGEIRFYRGTDAQPLDPLVQYAYGDFASRFPHLAYICFGTDPEAVQADPMPNIGTDFHWTANNPTPKPISCIVGAYPHGLVDAAIVLGIPGYTDPRIGHDANPMEVIYAAFVDKVWGMGEPSTTFNIPQLISKAIQLKKEGRGISTTFVNQSLDDFIDDVERHIRGTLVENPQTGLVEMQLLRGDYVLADLTVLTKENTFDFQQHEGHFLETLNQIEVRYPQFDGGTAGVFTDILVTDDAKFHYGVADWTTGLTTDRGSFSWQSPGRRLANVTAVRTRAGVPLTLTFDVDYRFYADEGWFVFLSDKSTNRLLDGDTIEVSFESQPLFSGFVEATASSQNQANFQITGYTRSESYDYPMFTQRALAQEMADFLKLTSGRKLAVFTWGMHRVGSHLKAGDVVLANELDYRLANMPIRVTKRSAGTLEQPGLRFEGVEDIFGEGIPSFLPVVEQAVRTPHTFPPIIATVTTSCLGGATRIGLLATDPSLTIQLWRADDDVGTGAVLIATLPGTTRYYDDPQTVGVEKFYAANLTGTGYETTGLSEWMGCTASATPPDEPSDEMPTWVLSQTETDTLGTATLTVTDPQSRVIRVERKSRPGNDSESAYETFAAAPYVETVPIIEGAISSITFRITYIGPDQEEISAEETAFFPAEDVLPPPPPPSIPDSSGGTIILPFHTILSRGAVFHFPPAEIRELHEFGRRRINATMLRWATGQTQISQPLPSGAYVGFQYVPATVTSPLEEDWSFLDHGTGPHIAADVVTDNPENSVRTQLHLSARQDIVIRAVSVGGNDVTPLGIRQMLLVLEGDAIGSGGEGDTPVEDPCQETTESFGGFEDQSDFESEWFTSDVFNTPPFNTSWHLDLTGGVGGSRALKSVTHEAFRAGSVWSVVKYRVIPNVPVGTYRIEGQIKTDWEVGAVRSIFNEYPVPGILIGTDPNFPAAGSVVGNATAAAHNKFETVISGNMAYDPALHGDFLFGVHMFQGSLTGGQLTAIYDNLKLVRVSDGATISPCVGGPTIPGDGGYYPGDDDGAPPPVLPPAGERRLYLWGYHPDMWGDYPPFNATHIHIEPNQLVSALTLARSIGMKIILVPVSTALGKYGGVFNQSVYLNNLNRYAGLINYADWLDVLLGIEVMDEPNSAKQWGTIVPLTIVDRVLAKRCQEIFGDIPRQVRMPATTWEEAGVRPSYVQISVNHWLDRHGPVADFMTRQRAACRRLGMAWSWGANPLNGGSGESGRQGQSSRWWVMSPREILSFGIPAALDTESHSISIWAGLNPSDLAFLQEAAYQSAFQQIVNTLNA